jgi:hypothetical protein
MNVLSNDHMNLWALIENGLAFAAILFLVWRVDTRLEQVRLTLERLATLSELHIRNAGERRRKVAEFEAD